MNTQRNFIAGAAGLLATTVLAYAYRAAHPSIAPAPTVAAARALLADTEGPAVGRDPQFHVLFSSQDNVRGIEFAVFETGARYVAVFRPFAVPPAYQSHLTQSVTPGFGTVRLVQAGLATDYPMTLVGAALVARIPKSDIALPGVCQASVAAWDVAADPGDPDQAFFDMNCGLLFQ